MSIKKLNHKNSEFENNDMDFEQMLNQSFEASEKKLHVGDKIEAEILSLGPEFVIVSTGTRVDGFVPSMQMQNGAGEFTAKSGEKVTMFVTKVTRAQIFLSPNPAEQNKADNIEDAFNKNMRIEGKVTGTNTGGFDVDLQGKRAFCPMAQMDTKRIEDGAPFVGKTMEFKIIKYEQGGRNIVLSRRKVLEEEQGQKAASFSNERNVGDKVKGTVTRIEPFGAFIDIGSGIEGMAHISELAWERVAKPEDVVSLGDVVTVTIKNIENSGSRMKIALSLKDDSNNPWKNMPSHIKTGQVVSGKITRCMPFGAFAELHPGLEGLIPLSQMSATKRVNSADEVVKPGDVVSLLVKEIDSGKKRISLSIKDAANQEANMNEAQDIADYKATDSAKAASQSLGGSLADKLQAALDSSKK
ncbi:S1 RNA-binding domain-containing protein [bacterium]|nr:S1 RNA-binding domain-containing protein [bacterium]